MNTEDETRDLPVLRVGERDLPILVPGSGPRHERANAEAHPGWSNFASQRHIRGLAVDPTKGEVWLATGGGVLRWIPGLHCFTRYGSEHGLPGNSVVAVAIDGNGLVWVAHDGLGVSYFDGAIWRSYAVLDGTVVNCLSRDSFGRLWVGSESGAYAISHPSQRPGVELPPFGEPPRAIAATNEDDVWLCSARGVFHFEHGDWARYNVRPDVLTLIRQHTDLWLGTLGGLIRITLATGEVDQSDAWPSGEVTALASAHEGIWIACGGEVGRVTQTRWTPITTQRLAGRVTSIAAAGDEEVWIGTHNGLLRGGPTGLSFQLTDTPPDVIGLPDSKRPSAPLSNMIQALSVQHVATGLVMWIGTARDLFSLEVLTESWKRFPGTGDVRAVVAGITEEEMWVASWSSGLYRLKGRSIQAHIPNIPGPVHALAKGCGSDHWAAGLDGLYRGDGETWTLAIPAEKFPAQSWIRTVVQAPSGLVWVGTSTGVFTYHPDTDALTLAASIPGSLDIRSLLSLLKDATEHLWIGTNHGLYGGSPTHVKLIPGFEGQRVTALTWDSTNNGLWVGTSCGLFCLVEKGNGWAIAKALTTRNSGLAADRVTTLALSGSESGESTLWIGTSWGLSCYRY